MCRFREKARRLNALLKERARSSKPNRMKRFTKPKFLEQIGRGQLGRLLAKFLPDFAANNITLPQPDLEDGDYYAAVSKLAVGEPGLPDNLFEALHSVDALANTVGKGRLLRAVELAGVPIDPNQQVTDADFAVQVLLTEPTVFKHTHDEYRIAGLSSFEYHGCPDAIDRRATFEKPDAAGLARIKRDIDDWLAEQREGAEHATEIEMHEMDEEFWFLIRRGDSLARLPAVEGGRFIVRHLRPARDLVVVYTPQRDELRIYGKSTGEKKKLRQIFGERLMGSPDYFSVRNTFTLAPLREDGPDALRVEPGMGIERIVLTELEVRTDDEHDAVLVTRANDLFAYADANRLPAIPVRGRLVCAGFEVLFTGQDKTRMVYLSAGNKLRLTRHCDGLAVHRWLTANGFRNPEEPAVNRLTTRHEIRLERN